MISITSYFGDSASLENNAKVISIDKVKLYFSYETLVAIEIDGKKTVVQNYWGPTTGKHLNAIDGGSEAAKKARVSKEELNDYAKGVQVIAAVQ